MTEPNAITQNDDGTENAKPGSLHPAGSTASSFSRELEQLINKYSRENGSDTPDFILAEYLMGCLLAFDQALDSRERWYGRKPKKPEPGPQMYHSPMSA